MNSCSRFLNSTLRGKTRDNTSSLQNIAHIPKKQLQVQVLPAMKGFFQKAEISTSRLILVDTHGKSARRISFRSSAAGTSNDQVKCENIQVFISFRGETRTGFTGHLYKELTQAGYHTFIDELMRRGENIEKEIIKAIRNSEASLLVISPDYASSESCLDELVEILRCRRCFGHKVLPVFHHGDPDDFKNQTGNFGAAFDGLVEGSKDAKDKRLSCWKEVLKEVTGISGLVLCQYEYETHFIDRIVAEVEKLLSAAPQHVPSFVVAWHSFIHGFNSWTQSAPSIESYIIVECAGTVAASKYLFGRLNEGLMIILLGIAASLYLRSVKRTEKLKNDRPSKKC